MSVFSKKRTSPPSIAIVDGHRKIRLLFKPEGPFVSKRTLGLTWQRIKKRPPEKEGGTIGYRHPIPHRFRPLFKPEGLTVSGKTRAKTDRPIHHSHRRRSMGSKTLLFWHISPEMSRHFTLDLHIHVETSLKTRFSREVRFINFPVEPGAGAAGTAFSGTQHRGVEYLCPFPPHGRPGRSAPLHRFRYTAPERTDPANW